MSQTKPASRRGRWDTRARRAQRRLVLYNNVAIAIDVVRGQGGHPLEMVWKRPKDEIRALMQSGGEALRVLGRGEPANVRQAQIERLEGVLDQIAAADDWIRRLHLFYQALRTERARSALTKLVRLGCVPHDLVRCVRTFTDDREATALAGKRQETRAYLPRLQRLTESFAQLADDCDGYNKLEERYGGTTFRLDRNMAAFLRDEAASMGGVLRDADPRRHRMFTMANAHLMDMMRDIKTITGQFQDALVADFLNGVPEIRVSAGQLRQFRARHGSRGKAWTPPRYMARPASRIVMGSAAPNQGRPGNHS